MDQIPRERRLDSTYDLWSEGYRYISNRCQRHGTDVFQARLLLEPTLCMRGHAAAQLFYDNDRFTRQGATPPRIQKTLFGQGGVQGLDGEEHRHRKAMFMALMSPESIERLVSLTTEQWRTAVTKWQGAERVVLLPAVREVLCRAVCAWAEVPLKESEVARRTADLGAMIDGSAAIGPDYWRSRRARRRAEAWAGSLIEAVRAGELSPTPDTALDVIARHCTLEAQPLSTHIAAVELLNVLRPTVAIGRYVVFAALALHHYPDCLAALRDGGQDAYPEWFAQEVRRFYPFFPFVGARVRDDFTWQGLAFPKGRRVLLDLYGTNHDTRLWEQPEAFRPERFRSGPGDAYSLIPQGGGDHSIDHRCPGEWITIALLKRILTLLARELRYQVPPQDLHVDLSKVPTAPKSGFVIQQVRPRS